MQPFSHTGYVSCAHLCAFTTEPAYREAPVTSLFHEYLQVLIRIRTWLCFSSPRSQSSPCLVDLTILKSTRIRDEECVLSSPSVLPGVITKHRLEDLSLNNRECWGCQHRGASVYSLQGYSFAQLGPGLVVWEEGKMCSLEDTFLHYLESTRLRLGGTGCSDAVPSRKQSLNS